MALRDPDDAAVPVDPLMRCRILANRAIRAKEEYEEVKSELSLYLHSTLSHPGFADHGNRARARSMNQDSDSVKTGREMEDAKDWMLQTPQWPTQQPDDAEKAEIRARLLALDVNTVDVPWIKELL
jgi:hypothetical protein